MTSLKNRPLGRLKTVIDAKTKQQFTHLAICIPQIPYKVRVVYYFGRLFRKRYPPESAEVIWKRRFAKISRVKQTNTVKGLSEKE